MSASRAILGALVAHLTGCFPALPAPVQAPAPADADAAESDVATDTGDADLDSEAPGACVGVGAPHPTEPCAVCDTDGHAAPCPTTCAAGRCLRIEQIGLGTETCVRMDDGSVWCWELGTLTPDLPPDVPPPERVDLPGPATELAVGENSTSVLLDSGVVMCWGFSSYGQCGVPAKGSQPYPVQAQVTGLTHLEAGADAICGIDAAGRVRCWGRTIGGIGPNGAPIAELANWEPYEIALPEGFVASQVSVGDYHACAVGTGADEQVWCWGWNGWNQVGGPVGEGTATPVAPIGAVPVDLVATGKDATIAVGGGGEVMLGWGSTGNGVLGRYAADFEDVAPMNVMFDEPIADVVMGGKTACALSADGDAWCWGLNLYEELGTDAFIQSDTPVPVPGDRPVRLIAVAPLHATCYVDDLGALWCMGWGYTHADPDGASRVLITWPDDA